jgi:hypothetical protein
VQNLASWCAKSGNAAAHNRLHWDGLRCARYYHAAIRGHNEPCGHLGQSTDAAAVQLLRMSQAPGDDQQMRRLRCATTAAYLNISCMDANVDTIGRRYARGHTLRCH